MEPQHKWLISVLEIWDETFDEDTEIPTYIDKIKNQKPITPVEYEEILFHLWQKFYDIEF